MSKVYIEEKDDEGTPYWYNKNAKNSSWERPSSGYLELTNNSGKTYYENLATGETMWNLPNAAAGNNRWNNAASAAGSSAEVARLQADLDVCHEKVRRLESELAAAKAAAPAAAAPVGNNSGPAAKFKKMLKMGIPRPAVEQKMRAEGVDPALLNAKGSAAPAEGTEVPRVAAARPPMAGLLAGIAAAPKLKKANTTPAAAPPPKPPTAQEQMAAELKARLAKRGAVSVNVEAQLAANKAARAAAWSKTPGARRRRGSRKARKTRRNSRH